MTLIKDVMNKGVVTTGAEDTLLVAAKKMVDHGIGCLIVDSGEQLGVVTEQDFLKFIVNDRRDVMEVKVSEIMTSPAITGTPEMNIYEASQVMQEHGFRRLPIAVEGRLVGIVTQTDLNQALREDTIREMRAKLDELSRVNLGNTDKAAEIEQLESAIEEIEGSGPAQA